MTFKTEKTGKHLRSTVVEKGEEERRYAMHALSHHYGAGSNATLAKLLMAALGQDSVESGATENTISADLGQSPTRPGGQIAEPMSNSANDSDYKNRQASQG